MVRGGVMNDKGRGTVREINGTRKVGESCRCNGHPVHYTLVHMHYCSVA